MYTHIKKCNFRRYDKLPVCQTLTLILANYLEVMGEDGEYQVIDLNIYHCIICIPCMGMENSNWYTSLV